MLLQAPLRGTKRRVRRIDRQLASHLRLHARAGRWPGSGAPLYQRHIILHKEQKQILELHLYDKGLFLACDKQDREIYLCFAYYAWLMIVGDRRRND